MSAAAVYAEPALLAQLKTSWAKSALAFLASQDLPVREYEINQTPTSADGIYSWSQNQDLLFSELEGGHVRELGLYGHATQEQNLAGGWWNGLAYANLNRGYVVVSIPVSVAIPLPDLLRVAYCLAADHVAPVFSYGIAYTWPLHNSPWWYAVGVEATRTSDPRERLAPEIRRQLSQWRQDFLTTRSYLHAKLRDIYPANLLSKEHVGACLPGGKTLETLGIGRLSLLEAGQWLWEVPDQQLPAARAIMREAGLLICS
jgi:hypothetical protein